MKRAAGSTLPANLWICRPASVAHQLCDAATVIRQNGQFQPAAGLLGIRINHLAGDVSPSNSNYADQCDECGAILLLDRGAGAVCRARGLMSRPKERRGADIADQAAGYYDAAGTQTLPSAGSSYLPRIFPAMPACRSFRVIDDVEIFSVTAGQCDYFGSPQGLTFHVRRFVFSPNPRISRHFFKPRNGCAGHDELTAVSSFPTEQSARVQDAQTIQFLTANANDVKVRENRSSLFNAFLALFKGGGSHDLTGNPLCSIGDREKITACAVV